MTVKNEQPNTLFAARVVERMEALGLESIDLSDKTGATYQHIRGIVKGDSFPSPFFLRILCDVLQLDLDEMTKLLAADKIVHKFGGVPELLSGIDPTLMPVERVWKKLKKEQQTELIDRAKQLARQNRRAG
jgi:transcriptional regulator with XRE-family HTH domain